jgi:Uma2 family endonuclease
MATYPIHNRAWTRAEYDQLIARGSFRPDERLELLGGQLVVREPQGSRHAVAIELAHRALQRAFGPAWRVRVQLPIALEAESEPEPDFSVVAGDPRASTLSHPADPVLIVEVAETSLTFDREHKGSLYARAGIMDYWIVNLVDRELEVYRDPVVASRAPFGWQYGQRQSLSASGIISALANPSAGISVADLMP